jgi:hypothetical protein
VVFLIPALSAHTLKARSGPGAWQKKDIVMLFSLLSFSGIIMRLAEQERLTIVHGENGPARFRDKRLKI